TLSTHRSLRPRSPLLFPYTTLFRSVATGASCLLEGGRMARDRPRALGVRQDLRDGRPLLVVVGVGDDLDQAAAVAGLLLLEGDLDRKSTRLNSSHVKISYAVFC